MEKKLDWKTRANIILGNTDNTAKPSVGKAIIMKLFSQFRSPISTKKMTNNETMAKTIETTPITDR